MVSGFSQRRRPFVSIIVDYDDSRGPTHIVTKLFFSFFIFHFSFFFFHFPRFKITLIPHQRNLRNLSFQGKIDWLGPFFRCSLLQFLIGFVIFPSLCLIVMQPSTIQHSFATLLLEAKMCQSKQRAGLALILIANNIHVTGTVK